MDPINQAREMALSTPAGSPLYQVAFAVCMMRNLDPWMGHSHSGLNNWQAVVMEAALLHMIQQELPR